MLIQSFLTALANVLVQITLIFSTASYTAVAVPVCLVCVYYVQRFYLLISRKL
jgi:hypothetical protein